MNPQAATTMPVNTRFRANTRLIGPHNALFENRPPRPWPKTKHPPDIVDLDSFIHTHRWVDDKIKDYIEFRRSNYLKVCQDVPAQLRLDAARFLYANNAQSRIDFAKLVLRHVQDHDAIKRGPLFYVTITPASFAFQIGQTWLLDRLFFGNGEGTVLARQIGHEARADYQKWEQRQPWARR